MKRTFILIAIILVAYIGISAQAKPKTIVFPKGKTSVVLKGNTASENNYVFRLRTAKRVQISIASAKNNAFFSFDEKKIFDQGLDFMCEECKTMNERVGPGLWMISVFHIEGEPADFTLKITIK